MAQQDKEVIKTILNELEKRRLKENLNKVQYAEKMGLSPLVYYKLSNGELSRNYSKVYDAIGQELGLSGYDLFLTINNPSYKHQLNILKFNERRKAQDGKDK